VSASLSLFCVYESTKGKGCLLAQFGTGEAIIEQINGGEKRWPKRRAKILQVGFDANLGPLSFLLSRLGKCLSHEREHQNLEQNCKVQL